MKHNRIFTGISLAVMFGTFVLTGCGKSGPPVPRDDIPVKELEITGNDKMKFNLVELEAKPRQRIELTLKNVGTMPKQSMGHDWVLVVQGTDLKEFVQAGMTHASTSYIAPSHKDAVLASTSILGPGESETISFTAPAEPGSYDYVCTFPGHLAGGMAGVLKIAE